MPDHLSSLGDFTGEEIASLIARAIELKEERSRGIRHQQLAGKSVALIFEKPSTRTRVSFESAMYGLGGQVLFLSGRDTQLSRSEPLKDMARVMSRYVDGIVVRTFGQEVVNELAQYATVPVINALTDLHHPCQILSDIMTVIEKKGAIQDLKIVWVGDGNNMANSWIQAAAKLGFELILACPEGYDPDAEILAAAQAEGAKPITLLRDPQTAVLGADVINVDVFASMGQESEQDERLKIFASYQVNAEMMAKAADDAIVLHCLPAHRGEEITEDVLEGPQCVAFDEAENKMHMHKAILERFLG
ncbi:ornithine carbamoyltransferase [Desulfotalea psychrophila]|uniref:Ornithine carbamoyltransferase n=1 Tax=Desulfotalea psychrophila (strain LSv54 / DSM 12343) TaxID=177439 RepID=OTC_DESPS|nr:ornithine carbamoyltransferase [Desulfotalea psychrophila]Q6AR58.1 RecName: Full=Ornithine carbamoyltransferase; Short=OTCase [Desulfotalea psychrophila LSv54]CAG35166.1 probable ornithine carbamoyltransferase [Desulfotalea psychrophila LSv54]